MNYSSQLKPPGDLISETVGGVTEGARARGERERTGITKAEQAMSSETARQLEIILSFDKDAVPNIKNLVVREAHAAAQEAAEEAIEDFVAGAEGAGGGGSAAPAGAGKTKV